MYLWGVSKNDGINIQKVVLKMEFNSNNRPVEIIKEEASSGSFFRDIFSGVNGKWYKNSQNEFNDLKNIDQNIILQIIIMLN